MIKNLNLKLLLGAAVACGALGLAAMTPAKADSIGIGVGPHGGFSVYLSDDDHRHHGYKKRRYYDSYYYGGYHRHGPECDHGYGYYPSYRGVYKRGYYNGFKNGHGYYGHDDRRRHHGW